MNRNRKFGLYLKECREKYSSHTPTSLARELGKSKQYITNLEKQVEPPPVFELCVKIVAVLNLPKEVANQLIQYAFFERIRQNITFYDYLNTPGIDSEIQNKEELLTNSIQTKENIQYDCIFGVCSHLKYPQLTDDPLIKQHIFQLITETITESQGTVIDLGISENSLYVIFCIFPNFNIKQFIQGLLDLVSRTVKNSIPQDKIIGKSIWKDFIEIKTLDSAHYTAHKQELQNFLHLNKL